MHQFFKGLFRFLPVQLLFLHFRKYQLLLIFWGIILATLTGNFASHFGAMSLFLAPEYLGEINFISMFLLGGSMAVFVMAWHITTFIIHSHRIPFMGALRQAFLKYCINNSLLPLAILIFYSIVSIRYQWIYEHAPLSKIWRLQLGFYLGFLIFILLSFAYFFRVDRDLFKVVISKITNPSLIREIIPYDTLDYEYDLIRADTYISETFKIEHISKLETYPPRLLAAVLRRHHRNAITATLFAYLTLVILGIFMEEPFLRIPSGAGFLLLFSISIGLFGAIKYFLKSWELIGWILIAALLAWLVQHKFFDLRSVAYGLNYHTAEKQMPKYNYRYLRHVFTHQRYEADKRHGEQRLNNWLKKRTAANETKPPVVLLCISGGGSRAAYWTFRSLQYIDSLTQGKLFTHTVMMSGASGGMLGGAYWRSIHQANQKGKIDNCYASKYQQNIGKDLLNAIIFSMVSVDLVSPFNKTSIGGYSYTKDRGYALERELIRNTDGMLDQKIGDYKQEEWEGSIPAMIINGTIVNDGRKLMISAQPVSYLTQPAYTLSDSLHPAIDAVDFATYFFRQNPYNLRLTSALRMNATFPYILPVMKFPSVPNMNVMDAGLRDNFGVDIVARYLFVFREWLKNYAGDVIMLQIRDTRECNVLASSEQNTLGKMVADPLFIIQNKWEAFQSYAQTYLKDYAPECFGPKLHFVTLQYIPQQANTAAALNFHLTQNEQQDLYRSVYHPLNQAQIDTLLHLLK